MSIRSAIVSHLTCTSLALAGFAGAPLPAQNVPTGFVVDTLVAAGLPVPHDFCFLPDGRCLIANKAGAVVVHGNGATATVGTVPAVETSYERGLLSIAADPGFAANGYVYVYYAHSGDAFLHVDRFTCTGDLADPTSTNLQFAASSRRVVLGTLVDDSPTHNGGSLRFGPDGMLYLTCGDDGVGCRAQSPRSQVGALLRFDVSTLPPGGSLALPSFSTLDPGDNPFSASGDSTQLLLAHGLRNPWRMDIDPATGNVYVADVGEFVQEEVSEYVRPASGVLPLANFGWPWREGLAGGAGCSGAAPAGLTDPIVTVPTTPWKAILVGPRYRSRSGSHDFGSGYAGCLFYADYATGEVRRLVHIGSWGPAPGVAGQPSSTEWGNGFQSITCLREGPDDALYFTQHPGSLKRVRPIGAANAITAVSGSGQRVASGETFPLPLTVRVVGPSGAAIANAPVDFAVAGPGLLSITNPVLTDTQGFAQTNVTAQAATGGAIAVVATTAGTPNGALFGLFARRLTVTSTATSFLLSIENQTDAVPALVPYIVMLSFPGSPALPTPFGTLCIHPGYALALVLEDGIGIFHGVSLSGTGGIGTPGLTRSYPIPPGLLAGQLMSFQAVGFDTVTGLFVTNCEQKLF